MFCYGMIVFSCDQVEINTANNEPIKTIGIINKDSTASPEVIPVPAPQIIQAKVTSRVNPLSGGLGRLYFDNYSAENGYSLGWTNEVFFDNKGMLWLTSVTGLLKYDGNSFITFTTKNGLPNDFVQCIIQDDLDNYWIGTSKGLSKYDGKSFSNFTKFEGLIDDDIADILKDNSGNLWIATSNGVSKYDGKSFNNFTTKQGLPADQVRDLMLDKQGNLWFSTWTGGLCKYDGNSFKTFSTKDGLIDNRIFSSYQDATNTIWVCTMNGLSKYDGQKFTNYTTKDGLPSDNIRSAVQDAVGNIWFSTFGGVSKYDGRHFVNYTTKDGLINNPTWKLTVDPAGNIWCPTSDGISKLNGVYLTRYTATEGFSATENGFTYILKDKTNNLWFNIPGGIGKYDGEVFSYYAMVVEKESLKDWANGLIMDVEGNIWFSLFGKGLFKFDGKTFTKYLDIKMNGINTSSSIIPDSKGNIWICGKGITKFDGKTYTSYTTAQGLISNLTTCINEDKAGNIWIGTYHGLSKYDGRNFTNYSVKQGLPSNEINSLKFESNGNMWLATSAGLIYYDGISFANYDKSDGIADNNIDQIAIDTVENKIWLKTFSGLSAIKKIKQTSNAGEKNIQVQNFNFQTGFPVLGSLFMAYYRDQKGVTWLTTSNNNLIRFDYNLVKQIPSPKLVINNITLNNQNICWNNLKPSGNKKTDSLVLINESNIRFQKTLSPAELKSMAARYRGIKLDSISPGNLLPYHLQIPFQYNNIGFEFSAISPASGNQVRYQHMLEGYDKNWSSLSRETKAVFGNMSAGNYIFRIKALGANGQWTETSYAFHVLPPWYITWWAYIVYVMIAGASIYSFIRWRIKKLQNEKSALEEKVTIRTTELKDSLENLKATQSQLIQSEKMASLGELTAGIAHEIQNPLNFVNNFSEVNRELLVEMKDEMDKGNIADAKEIANDLIANEEKINYHGKRAGDIVKEMLQHSRSSSGIKEPTDINALCDEYLRLSYHGYRAKDKSFNARFETKLDPNLPEVNTVPQDMGRVILNLINNAFHAVSEKLKAESKRSSSEYEPTVTIATKNLGDKIEISVKDNGIGIPDQIKEKIFQPFFTTKPTGQGTGLGLSLSYDIIKAHGGEIKLTTKEGEGVQFKIILPV